MAEFVRILNGGDKVTCHSDNWRRFVSLSFADECPEGFLPVVKADNKPTPEIGELLWFVYEKDGDVINKTYFCAPPPRRWTRLSIKRRLSDVGLWESVRDALVKTDFLDEFLMCDYVEEFDSAYSMMYASLAEAFGKEKVDEILDGIECI